MSDKRYMPQMDGLRALAVLGVLAHHWFHPTLPLGAWGVKLFFVLSGYLITKSIVELRDSGRSLWDAARTFFVRRTLRLFPAYYLVIVIGALLYEDVRRDWPWYATYLSNMLLAERERWIALTPTWSLAVEEQFYLVWFFLLFLFRSRTLQMILALAMIAPAMRFHYLLGGQPWKVYSLWTQCDALAAGAFLLWTEKSGRKLPLNAPVAAAMFFAALAAYALVPEGNPWLSAIGMPLVLMSSAFVVWRSRNGFPGLIGRILSSKGAVHVGKVSYGIYLYHMLTPALGGRLPFLGRLLQQGGFVGFPVHCALTIGLASLSFRYFEAPIRYSRWSRTDPASSG